MSKAPAKGQKMQALYAFHWIPSLSPAARRVGAWLVWHANASTGRCDPGQARLRTETGLSRRTIQNAVQELVDCDAISRKLRGYESTSYEIHWQTLSDLVAAYEERAKNGGKVLAPQGLRKGGRKKLHLLAQESTPVLAQETAPKLEEPNTRKEHVFRVGTISDESEDGAHSSPILVPGEKGQVAGGGYRALAWEGAGAHPDDVFAVTRMLCVKEDHAFVAYLGREVSNGRRFSSPVAERIYDRLTAIHSEHNDFGDPVAGHAYRLLETELCRGEAA